MRVAQVLRHKGADVVVISPSATVEELVGLLSEHNLGAVVVSDDGKSVAGHGQRAGCDPPPRRRHGGARPNPWRRSCPARSTPAASPIRWSR